MPFAHNLNKVKNNLSKATGSIHIKGRKFKQLNRATLRDKKIVAKKARALGQRDNENQIFKFIQEAVNGRNNRKTFELDDMKLFVESFLSRYDEELETLKNQRRPGRPATTRQQVLEQKIKHENHIYGTGIKIPNLTDEETVTRLRAWNGTSGGLTVMKFIQISRDLEQLPVEEVDMTTE